MGSKENDKNKRSCGAHRPTGRPHFQAVKDDAALRLVLMWPELATYREERLNKGCGECRPTGRWWRTGRLLGRLLAPHLPRKGREKERGSYRCRG